MQKKLVSAIFLKNGRAVSDLENTADFASGDAVQLAEDYSNRGADALLIFDESRGDAEHDESLTLERQMARKVDIPMYGFGNIRRPEDVKKILYAGCKVAVLNFSRQSNIDMLEEVSKRFGKEKIAVCIDTRKGEVLTGETRKKVETYAGELVVISDVFLFRKDKMQLASLSELPLTVFIYGSEELSMEEKTDILEMSSVAGFCENVLRDPETDIMELKHSFRGNGVDLNTFESTFGWGDLHPNRDGLIPVVVQDYRNDEVLMVAYMNEEAFNSTVKSGRMTYFSRSRQKLWVKGETSGHFQYLKELRVDCDEDTLLAKVSQIGAACHTGNRSCFYRTALKKDTEERNPMRVLEDVYAVIEDRKAHPKEGSYTNYLFDKGIDKILKKCGEEAAEIIIAAKNPNPEEVRYEMADFLYHMMVLMSEKGVTWSDITEELANR